MVEVAVVFEVEVDFLTVVVFVALVFVPDDVPLADDATAEELFTTVKSTVFEIPPPGAGLITDIGKLPVLARS